MGAVLCALLVALPLAQGVHAQPAAEEPMAAQAERTRIAAQRSRIDADYLTAQKACFKRFAVTDCRNDSRRQRDAARAVLRKREIELNDAERVRKADLQRDAIAARRLERARRDAEAAATGVPGASARDRSGAAGPIAPRARSSPRSDGPSKPIAPRGKPRSDDAARRAGAAADRAERAAQEAGNFAQRERLLREAAEHKADVLKTNAAREKPAAPLPVPTGADVR